MIGIYKITNQVNGKVYIGQSVDIQRRWKEHRIRPFNSNSEQYNCPLYRSIRKYGIENFNFIVLEECSINDLNEKEQFYIKKYNSINRDYGYNLVDKDFIRTGTQKIDNQELLEIISLLGNSSLSQREIADKYNISESTISQINSGKQLFQEGIHYPIRQNQRNEKGEVERKHYYCCDCGVEISSNGIRCQKCATLKNISKIYEKNNCPPREVLKNLIRTSTFTQIGKQFNVTDNGIRRWCEHYGLPRTKKEINKYTDEEWELI